MIYLPEHSVVGFNGIGIIDTCAKGVSTALDIEMEVDALINGGTLYVKDGVFGDYVNAYVGYYDAQNNFVALTQWIHSWIVPPPNADGVSDPLMVETEVFGEIFAGLVLRFVYNSTGTVKDPKVALNLNRYRRI